MQEQIEDPSSLFQLNPELFNGQPSNNQDQLLTPKGFGMNNNKFSKNERDMKSYQQVMRESLEIQDIDRGAQTQRFKNSSIYNSFRADQLTQNKRVNRNTFQQEKNNNMNKTWVHESVSVFNTMKAPAMNKSQMSQADNLSRQSNKSIDRSSQIRRQKHLLRMVKFSNMEYFNKDDNLPK